MGNVVVLAATVEQLEMLRTDRAAFGVLLGSEAPDGWPVFPESIEFTIAQLTEHPHQADWWMHFFLAYGGSLLVGSGGFVGPPVDGVVEIGYEIAPAYRDRGLATEATRAMINKAVASGRVGGVIAHTLAAENPSTGVLRRLGFRWSREVTHAEDGDLWRWELPVPVATAARSA
jgi:ribosomal-protein-alanine N-acetyltransferase